METSRTLLIPKEARDQLSALGDINAAPMCDEIQELLPKAMTRAEVIDVRDQIAINVENALPSWDGCSRGREVADRAVFRIGAAAAVLGDTETTESVIDYLKAKPFSISKRVGAFVLRHKLKSLEA